MEIDNIFNLKTIELLSKTRKHPLYNIKKSATDSSDMESEKLGFDIKELEPGKTPYPYHYHTENEEIYIIIEGEVSLRQNNQIRILKEGDFVFLSAGKEGAHQLYNHSEKRVKYLGISSKEKGDICYYPDSRKINAGNGEIYKLQSRTGYYEGEENLSEFWEKDTQ